jgi:LPS-assembly lipoprotein
MRTALLALTLLLSACGFQLRGHGLREANFAFHSIYLRVPAETPFVDGLRSGLKSYKLQLAPSANKADLIFEVISESRDKQILALGGGGQVNEYELYYRVSFRVYDNQQRDWLPPGEIQLQSDFNYDNSQVLAMAEEEAQIYDSMYSDAVQQVLRRLSLAKPPQPDTRRD